MMNLNKGLAILSLTTMTGVATAQYLQSDDTMPSPHYQGLDQISFLGSSLKLVSIDCDVNTGRVKAPTGGSTVTTPLSGPGFLVMKGDQTTQQPFGTLIDSMISIHDDGGGHYSMEMLQMNIHGGNLPQGTRLRESPTLVSTGQTTITPQGNQFQFNSFFDIFFELSTDDGQSYMPALGPEHMTGGPTPEPATFIAIGAGLVGFGLRRRKKS